MNETRLGKLRYSERTMLDKARKCQRNEADFTCDPIYVIDVLERLGRTRASRDKAVQLLASRDEALRGEIASIAATIALGALSDPARIVDLLWEALHQQGETVSVSTPPINQGS